MKNKIILIAGITITFIAIISCIIIVGNIYNWEDSSNEDTTYTVSYETTDKSIKFMPVETEYNPGGYDQYSAYYIRISDNPIYGIDNLYQDAVKRAVNEADKQQPLMGIKAPKDSYKYKYDYYEETGRVTIRVKLYSPSSTYNKGVWGLNYDTYTGHSTYYIMYYASDGKYVINHVFDYNPYNGKFNMPTYQWPDMPYEYVE